MPNAERVGSAHQIDPQDAARAIETSLRYPKTMNLKFPTRLHIFASEEGIHSDVVLVDAIKAGSLLSRGNISQLIGGVPPISLSMSDFPPYFIKGNEYSNTPPIDSDTIRFMRERAPFKTNKPQDDANDFFLRSLTLWRRFLSNDQSRGLLKIVVDGKEYEATQEGIQDAYEAADLPYLVFSTEGEGKISIIPRKPGVVYKSKNN